MSRSKKTGVQGADPRLRVTRPSLAGQAPAKTRLLEQKAIDIQLRLNDVSATETPLETQLVKSMASYRPTTKRRHRMIAVVVPELAEGYFTLVMNGLEEHLLRAGYLHFIVSHQGCPDLLSDYSGLLKSRMVDGLIVVNTSFTGRLEVPVVTISGHTKTAGVTNIIVDHDRAAALALSHLYDLGHRRIAFMKGPREVRDSESRWQSIVERARDLGLPVHPELCMYLHSNPWSPELGYPAMCDLLATTQNFTAVFCFNDLAAIGAIRALKDSALSCPGDVSVIGFDDIASVAFHDPSLTTVRQPLKRMGEMAAQMVLSRIHTPGDDYPDTMVFQPELIVRESTGPVRGSIRSSSRTRSKRQQPN